MKSITPYKGITLEFDENRHRFTIDGRSVLSVTAATGIIDKSRPLIFWAIGLMKNHLFSLLETKVERITDKDIEEASRQHSIAKEKAATIGDVVHEFAEHWALGLKPEVPTEEKARNGALAFLKWVDSEGINLINPEQLIYSKKYDYAGIADAEGVKGKKRYLIDFKTSKKIYPEMFFQTSAYLHALIEIKKTKFDGIFVLRFDKETGDFEPVFIDPKESKKDFAAFLGALAVKRRLKELDKYER